MSVIWLPKASPLFIDMLSMTLAISEHEQQAVKKNFQHDLAGYFGGKLYASSHYHLNKKVYLEEQGQILFQCQPKASNMNFFRIEWNPVKVATEAVAGIVDFLVPGGYAGLVSYGRITRIDIATDVMGLQMRNCLFHYPGMMVEYNYLSAGSIQTAYLGSAGGVNQFRFYDKVAETKKSNATKPKQYKVPLPKHPVTRIEWQYRPNLAITLQNIGEKIGPIYQKLWCGQVSKMPNQPKSDFESFVHTVIRMSRYEGLPQALYSIPKHHRAKVLSYLKKNLHASWWSPDRLLGTLPTAIKQVNPPQNKYIIHQQLNNCY